MDCSVRKIKRDKEEALGQQCKRSVPYGKPDIQPLRRCRIVKKPDKKLVIV
jgi:hypothetical protein